jgi:cyclic pyranopterin phosphate synthase
LCRIVGDPVHGELPGRKPRSEMSSVDLSSTALSPVVPPEGPLVDLFGRAISYLRVSVTDRCDFRCVYCMSEDMNFLPKQDLLTLEELDRL